MKTRLGLETTIPGYLTAWPSRSLGVHSQSHILVDVDDVSFFLMGGTSTKGARSRDEADLDFAADSLRVLLERHHRR